MYYHTTSIALFKCINSRKSNQICHCFTIHNNKTHIPIPRLAPVIQTTWKEHYKRTTKSINSGTQITPPKTSVRIEKFNYAKIRNLLPYLQSLRALHAFSTSKWNPLKEKQKPINQTSPQNSQIGFGGFCVITIIGDEFE